MQKARICVDADGGDFAPAAAVEGVRQALAQDPSVEIVLVGRDDSVSQVASEFPDRVRALRTTEVIEMGDHPANAVRSKKDSSIVVGCKLVGAGEADGFFSAGSTGACLTAATLFIGRSKGVSRPAIATVVPAIARPVVLLDSGANAECKGEYYLQFAQMGVAYSKCMLGKPDVSVGLLSNGSEDSKGTGEVVEANAILREKLPGFVGNVEGNDIAAGSCDVVVTDGFTGNIALKTLEGTAAMVMGSLKRIMGSLAQGDAGASEGAGGASQMAEKLKGPLREFARSMDAEAYGGAPLLGIKRACFIGHGSSSANAVANGILVCAKAVRDDLPGAVERELAI